MHMQLFSHVNMTLITLVTQMKHLNDRINIYYIYPNENLK